MAAKNALPPVKDLPPTRRRRTKPAGKNLAKTDPLYDTRAGKQIRQRQPRKDPDAPRVPRRRPPAVPKGKTVAEIKAMDGEDPELKHSKLAKPKKKTTLAEGSETSTLTLTELRRREKQRRSNKRKGVTRKAEAVVVAAVEELGIELTPSERKYGITVDDKLIAEGHLGVEDWTVEELARGYRKNRNGKFGAPPKYTPREVHNAIVKEISRRGEKQLRDRFIDAMENVAQMATGDIPVSDKVQLDAARFLADRVVGKVPDILRVGPDAPWQDMLADSIEVPDGDVMDAYVVVSEEEGEVEPRESPRAAGAKTHPSSRRAPSPSAQPPSPKALPPSVVSLFDPGDDDIEEAELGG